MEVTNQREVSLEVPRRTTKTVARVSTDRRRSKRKNSGKGCKKSRAEQYTPFLGRASSRRSDGRGDGGHGTEREKGVGGKKEN